MGQSDERIHPVWENAPCIAWVSTMTGKQIANDLKGAVQDIWSALPLQYIRSLYESLPGWIPTVLSGDSSNTGCILSYRVYSLIRLSHAGCILSSDCLMQGAFSHQIVSCRVHSLIRLSPDMNFIVLTKDNLSLVNCQWLKRSCTRYLECPTFAIHTKFVWEFAGLNSNCIMSKGSHNQVLKS
jgi:hypothetical protein